MSKGKNAQTVKLTVKLTLGITIWTDQSILVKFHVFGCVWIVSHNAKQATNVCSCRFVLTVEWGFQQTTLWHTIHGFIPGPMISGLKSREIALHPIRAVVLHMEHPRKWGKDAASVRHASREHNRIQPPPFDLCLIFDEKIWSSRFHIISCRFYCHPNNTMSTTFFTKIQARSEAIGSLLCVGLDPHEKELFEDGWGGRSEEERCNAAFTFCKTLIDATLPYTVCYKPNAAFFEALGDGGFAVLRRICRDVIPIDVPVLLDVKRGDIGTTAVAYAQACYDHIGADAVTLSPLMGWDSISPFVTENYAEKGAFLLCKTSNPGSNDLLALGLAGEATLFERIAKLVGTEWATKSGKTLGLVVGATDSVAMSKARKAAGDDVWILAPGVGAQGGDLLESLQAGLNRSGSGLLIPVSRGISKAANPAAAAKELHEKIQEARKEIVEQGSKSVAEDIAPYQKEFLEFSLSLGVLKFGSFVLKSGRTSPYFFNAGLFASGAALHKLGCAYASTIVSSEL